jgi:hypothetical protein
VNLVHAKYCRVTEWSQVVVFRLPVPDDQVVEDKSDLGNASGKVAVKRKDTILRPQVDHDNAAVVLSECCNRN